MADLATPSYTTRVSAATMAEQSKKATEEGMRELAAALAERRNKITESSCSESDESSESDDSSWSENLRRPKNGLKRRRIVPTNAIEKLEDRVRFLTYDLSDATVTIEEWRTKTEDLNRQIVPYKRVNEELALLKSAINRLFKDPWYLTKTQLDDRYKLISEEANEHAVLCNAAIQKLDLDEIKVGLARVLNSERRRLAHLQRNFKYLIRAVWLKETIVFVICCLFALAIFAGFYKSLTN